MTIRQGQPWGTIGPAPADVAHIGSDAELRRHVERARRADVPIAPVALLGGDLMRSVGGTGDAARLGGHVAALPIDIVRVEADGRVGWFVAHLVARRSWWRGPLVAALNGQYLGQWDVAPRAHPNDGRVDVVAVARSMTLRDRRRARARLAHGTHLPHPQISLRHTVATELTFERSLHLTLDGIPWGEARELTLTVEPDSLVVHI